MSDRLHQTRTHTYTPPAPEGVRAYLSAQEITALQARSSGQAALILAGNWALIFLAFALAGFGYAAMPAVWASLGLDLIPPLCGQAACLVLALMLLAGRQMALAVVMHEAVHETFFKSKALNAHLCGWLAAAPMAFYAEGYKHVHVRHHRLGGTLRDPDAPFVRGYPALPASMARKILRDISGVVGVKTLVQNLRLHQPVGWLRFLVVHALLAALLWYMGIGWSYLLWWAAFFFFFPFIFRLRLMGEHGTALAREHGDVRHYTTTVLAGPLERLFIAPNGVHYHVEHHLMPAVPIYRLRQLHRLLHQRGFFNTADCLRPSYWAVLQRAILHNSTSPPAAHRAPS
jgi:fatty acid desaturase